MADNQFFQFRFYEAVDSTKYVFEKDMNFPKPTQLGDPTDKYYKLNLTVGTLKIIEDSDEPYKTPETVKDSLIDGSLIASIINPIRRLGIQTLPGVKFTINEETDPIVIGYSGLYEIDLDDKTEIQKICFDATSIERINNSPEGYLIVDVVGASATAEEDDDQE